MDEDVVISVYYAIKSGIVGVVKDSFDTFFGFLIDEFTESSDGFFGRVTKVFSNESTSLFLSIFANGP